MKAAVWFSGKDEVFSFNFSIYGTEWRTVRFKLHSFCGGKGLPQSARTRDGLSLLGCGWVDPAVFRVCGGEAAGLRSEKNLGDLRLEWGVERIAMK